MNLRTAILPGLVSLTFACASTPSSEIKSADAELTSSQQKARDDQAKLDQEHAHERASATNQGADRNDRAELAQKQQSERAETRADGQVAVSDAQKDVAGANEGMAQDRRDFDAKTKARFTKLDAKAKELKTKSARLDAKKKSDFNANLAQYETERGAANTKASKLSAATKNEWETSKKDVEAALDHMEATLDKAAKDL